MHCFVHVYYCRERAPTTIPVGAASTMKSNENRSTDENENGPSFSSHLHSSTDSIISGNSVQTEQSPMQETLMTYNVQTDPLIMPAKNVCHAEAIQNWYVLTISILNAELNLISCVILLDFLLCSQPLFCSFLHWHFQFKRRIVGKTRENSKYGSKIEWVYWSDDGHR